MMRTLDTSGHGTPASFARHTLLTALTLLASVLLSASAPASANPEQSCDPTALACTPEFDPGQTYPLLPDLPGADVEGEAGVVVHLLPGRAVIEQAGGFYELGGRPLELAFGDLSMVRVVIELPGYPLADGSEASVFVTEGDPTVGYAWLETLTSGGGSVTRDLVPEDLELSYGFEIGAPEAAGPTVPDLVIKPVPDKPEPE
ncbi:hypothetical protein PPSIR1_36829 [Plesiocystis pacifica SIR-1]|uniref:Lipoprotein n=1 Tax=Plesiocystis pacifica SIR-1 TaxID=391625 RepID=A6G0D1_9BACT|nr:hypothetical protein [Plesiocystis pacifica]EDM80577.1 hypothetical protein PPSIR1_36829 [Plesiocystis pacifica SIR-1]